MELVPAWLVEERLQVCVKCDMVAQCDGKLRVKFNKVPCPLNKFDLGETVVTQRAFPPNAARVSGCCDPVGLGWGDS
jgi:hypothetical protein